MDERIDKTGFTKIEDMKILLAAATWMEVKLLAEEFDFESETNEILSKYAFAGNEIEILITGIGTTFTTFRLTKILQQQNYDMVINLGIAGSLKPGLKIGEVVNVVSDEFADLGIEQREKFLTLFETDFIEANEFPFYGGVLKAALPNGWLKLKSVHAITTNKSHGRKNSIKDLKQKFDADMETMEGAAVFFVCLNLGLPCYQIRAISNYVEPHDPSKWDIPAALINLKSTFLKLLKNLPVPVN